MSWYVDGKRFRGVRCNFNILNFWFALLCSLSLGQLNLKKKKIHECAHVHECGVV